MSGYFENLHPAIARSGQNAEQWARSSALAEKASFLSASGHTDSNIMIKTSQGDVVTLSSQSFYDFEAVLYDSEGRIRNAGGEGFESSLSYREMTLASGESFEFSVKGDLNEEELDDIQQIVSDIDGVLEQMAGGDMQEAVELAMKMGGYDSVSRLTAELSVERSYTAVSRSRYQQSEVFGPVPAEGKADAASLFDQAEKLAETVKDRLERVEKELGERSKDPVEKLFARHVERWRRNRNFAQISPHGSNTGQENRFSGSQGFLKHLV